MIICVFHRKFLISIAGNGAGSNIIIIMHVYIASVPGNPVQRRCTIIIIPDSDLFQSNTHTHTHTRARTHTYTHTYIHTSTPRGVYITCYYIGVALIMHMTISTCQVFTYGGVIHSPHDGIAVEEPRTATVRLWFLRSNLLTCTN